jgi:hypothetical protein
MEPAWIFTVLFFAVFGYGFGYLHGHHSGIMYTLREQAKEPSE